MPTQKDYDAAVAAYAVIIAKAAGVSASFNAKYCHRIDDAAQIVARRSGARCSTRSLHKSNLPRVYIGQVALFAEEDLHRFADKLLNAAELHHGPRPQPRASKPSASRRSSSEAANAQG